MSQLQLKNEVYTFANLAAKYRDFEAPIFDISVDGKSLTDAGLPVSSITISQSIEESSSCEFSVFGSYILEESQFAPETKALKIGQKVEVSVGYVDQLQLVFYGAITGLSYDYQPEGPTIRVTALDMLKPMMSNCHARMWMKKKKSDVVKEVANYYQLSTTYVDETTEQYEVLHQGGLSDYEWLRQLADEEGRELFVFGKNLYFRKRLSDQQAVIKLNVYRHLLSLHLDVSLHEQVSQVIVRGWCEATGEVVEAIATKPETLGSGSESAPTEMKQLSEESVRYMYVNVSSQTEAMNRAQAELNRLSMNYITGNGTCLGLPELQAGLYIRLDGTGMEMSELLLLNSVTHTLGANGYETSFTMEGNAL